MEKKDPAVTGGRAREISHPDHVVMLKGALKPCSMYPDWSWLCVSQLNMRRWHTSKHVGSNMFRLQTV